MALAEVIDEAAQDAFEIEVAKRLRQLRKAKDLTLAEVAIRCGGTTPQTIQRLETGNMSMSLRWLGQICAALEIEPHQLFCRDDNWQGAESAYETRKEARVVIAHGENFSEELQAFLKRLKDFCA